MLNRITNLYGIGFGTKVSHRYPQNNKNALQNRCICFENGKEDKMRPVK